MYCWCLVVPLARNPQMMEEGVYEFDFVSYERPSSRCRPVTTHTFRRVRGSACLGSDMTQSSLNHCVLWWCVHDATVLNFRFYGSLVWWS